MAALITRHWTLVVIWVSWRGRSGVNYDGYTSGNTWRITAVLLEK